MMAREREGPPIYSNEPQWCEHENPLNDGGMCLLCGKRIRGTELAVEDEGSSIFDQVHKNLGEE